jgi:uncharacterized NAD-dependent epimerase/dehydratase family protein
MLVLALLTALGLYLLGVPYWLTFGVFTGAVAVVPFFGTLVSTLLPALRARPPDGGRRALFVIILGVVIHLIEGNLVAPLITARRVELPPVLSIMAVLIVGQLLGPRRAARRRADARHHQWSSYGAILINRIYEGQGFPSHDARPPARAARAARRREGCSSRPAPPVEPHRASPSAPRPAPPLTAPPPPAGCPRRFLSLADAASARCRPRRPKTPASATRPSAWRWCSTPRRLAAPSSRCSASAATSPWSARSTRRSPTRRTRCSSASRRPGGRLPQPWLDVLEAALARGLDAWSGLHTFLADEPALAAAAGRSGARIHDLRRPPADLDVAAGRVREVDATVVLTVGSDCNIGKMTTQLQLRDAMRARGRRVRSRRRGRPASSSRGGGSPSTRWSPTSSPARPSGLTLQGAQDADVVLVEGQGSIIHPSYSGVTYGLLHGALPHAMVLCHQPSRTGIARQEWVRIPPLAELVAMHEAAAAPLRPAPVVAIALNTFDLSDAAARAAIAAAERETGLPATDPVRFDPAPLVDAVGAFHDRRVGALVG